MRIITDEAELKTCKLKDLISPIKNKLSQEEADTIKNAKDDNDRRTLVISYYNKYIDTVVQEAGEDPAKLRGTVINPEPPKTKPVTEVEQTAHVPPVSNNVTELTDKDKPGLDLTDYVQCIIRDMPGRNGTSTQSVETLLELVFRFPSGRVDFKEEKVKAKAFVELVKNCKKVKGMHAITEAQRLKVIKNLCTVNRISVKL
jgi:hypothetical protein